MFPIPWKVDILTLWLHKLLFFYLSITATALHRIFVCPFTKISWNWFPIFTPFLDKILSFYFIYFCNLSPCKVDLDDQTTVHFWAPGHREFDKPNLVLIHGYGANAKWQFVFQVGPLSRFFNLYVPDLLFFGESFTKNPDRTDAFQAKCLSDGMKRLGVERYSLYAISYGGYVGYRMAAETSQQVIDKVIIMSSGVGCCEDQKEQQIKNVGGNVNVMDLLLPQNPDDLRQLVNISFCKYYNFLKWVPDFFLKDFIHVMCKQNRDEKKKLAEYLMSKKTDSDICVLNQIPITCCLAIMWCSMHNRHVLLNSLTVLAYLVKETLLIWGDKDMVFPLSFGYHLQRSLGSKVKLEIIKDTGHAANLESPHSVADLIKGFILDSADQ